MFNLIKRDSRQIVKTSKSNMNLHEIKEFTLLNREEINKLKEEIEAINRVIEIEKKKSFKKEILNKILFLINFILIFIIFYILRK